MVEAAAANGLEKKIILDDVAGYTAEPNAIACKLDQPIAQGVLTDRFAA